MSTMEKCALTLPKTAVATKRGARMMPRREKKGKEKKGKERRGLCCEVVVVVK
jgi:hypothetical protein